MTVLRQHKTKDKRMFWIKHGPFFNPWFCFVSEILFLHLLLRQARKSHIIVFSKKLCQLVDLHYQNEFR